MKKKLRKKMVCLMAAAVISNSPIAGNTALAVGKSLSVNEVSLAGYAQEADTARRLQGLEQQEDRSVQPQEADQAKASDKTDRKSTRLNSSHA